MMKKILAAGMMVIACSAAACSADDVEPAENVELSASELRGQFCGGIAGFACPTGYTCVDDPRDSCDPNTGGADCGGICIKAKGCHGDRYVSRDPNQCAAIRFICEEGREPFFNNRGCGCTCAGTN